jgi:hypothetical protein
MLECLPTNCEYRHLTKKEENGFLVLNYGILLEKRTKEFDVKTFTVAEGSDQDQIAPSEGMINEKREKNCKMTVSTTIWQRTKKYLVSIGCGFFLVA